MTESRSSTAAGATPPIDCAECEPAETAGGPEVAGTCYSARNCRGKVLNHRDMHNCKLSGGKSWRSPSGICRNL